MTGGPQPSRAHAPDEAGDVHVDKGGHQVLAVEAIHDPPVPRDGVGKVLWEQRDSLSTPQDPCLLLCPHTHRTRPLLQFFPEGKVRPRKHFVSHLPAFGCCWCLRDSKAQLSSVTQRSGKANVYLLPPCLAFQGILTEHRLFICKTSLQDIKGNLRLQNFLAGSSFLYLHHSRV